MASLHIPKLLLYLALSFTYLCWSVCYCHGASNEDSLKLKGNRLLVISFDGFRYDFLERNLLNLEKLYKSGVRAESLTSSYITKTFPNHLSIVTGLYEESHGIVSNAMYDPLWNESYYVCSDPSCGRWYGGFPIWNVNEHGTGVESSPRQNGEPRRSGLMCWPGTGAKINNLSVTFEIKYSKKGSPRYLNLTERIDVMLGWFKHESTPINLGLLYYEQPDQHCHEYGPDSSQVNATLKMIDDGVGYLFKQMEALDLDDLNVVIVSDHGFANVDGDFIYLSDCIDERYYDDVVDNHPMMSIWPKDDSLEELLYEQLKNCPDLHVYRKNNSDLIKLHYSKNRRIAPLTVMTDISPDGKSAKEIRKTRPAQTEKGNHGWNNSWSLMHAVFVAKGPAFKVSYRRKSFANINLYELMCHILGIKCPPNNGTLSTVSDMLSISSGNAWSTSNTIVLIAVVSLSLVVALILILGTFKQVDDLTYRISENGARDISAAERCTLLDTSEDDL